MSRQSTKYMRKGWHCWLEALWRRKANGATSYSHHLCFSILKRGHRSHEKQEKIFRWHLQPTDHKGPAGPTGIWGGWPCDKRQGKAQGPQRFLLPWLLLERSALGLPRCLHLVAEWGWAKKPELPPLKGKSAQRSLGALIAEQDPCC